MAFIYSKLHPYQEFALFSNNLFVTRLCCTRKKSHKTSCCSFIRRFSRKNVVNDIIYLYSLQAAYTCNLKRKYNSVWGGGGRLKGLVLKISEDVGHFSRFPRAVNSLN